MERIVQEQNVEMNSNKYNVTQTKRVLIVDDDPSFCRFTALGLSKAGYDFLTATDGQKALDVIEENKPDLVLMDIGLMREYDGIEVARQISIRWQIPVVYLTGRIDDKTLILAKETEPFGYVVKPVDYRELKTTIEIALYKSETENKLKELNKRLEQANQELRHFAHTVSHDLKTPLRGIRRLAEWISDNHANKLDKNDREQLNLLMNRVYRMYNLIDGVLQYSSVGCAEEEKVRVNLNKLVRDVIDMVSPPENITITVENKLPTIECSQTRITQVFENLLSNAVKHMGKPAGKIKISCAEEKDFWKFSIADHGPGIEEKYFEKIFQIFQTLSTHDESESSGIGLSTVKKIVEMYEGKVWVESKIGEGSIFLFTLPKQEKEITGAKLQGTVAS
jgi:signal transduction histidine kinase